MNPVTNKLNWKSIVNTADEVIEKAYVGDNTNEAFTLTKVGTQFSLASDITLEELQTSGQFATAELAKDYAQLLIKKHNIYAGTAYDGMPATNIETLPAEEEEDGGGGV